MSCLCRYEQFIHVVLNPHKFSVVCVVMSQWDAGVHSRIAGAIKKHRSGRSAQELADRTAELGYPISRAQIANYESGRKKNLDIAELLILAAALGVPPLVLLYPDLPDGIVEIIPGQPVSSMTAYMWATGMGRSFTRPDSTPTDGERLISAVRERFELVRELGRLLVAAADPSTDAKILEARRTELRARINGLEAQIREAGGVIKDA